LPEKRSQILEVQHLKSRPIWAALIASVVLLQPVYSVAAKPMDQRTPMVKPVTTSSAVSDRWPTTKGIAALHNGIENTIQLLSLEDFTATVITGEADRITGLYVPEFGGFNVIQQSADNDGIASPVRGVLTQFLRPAANRVIGLLAHNNASGTWFEHFPTGIPLFVIYGDGSKEIYKLTAKERFQAINGDSSTTDFIDLSSGEIRSANQVYQKMYSGKPHLTLQTCIQNGDDLNWGRLFLLANLAD
jgi:hypothetical protein